MATSIKTLLPLDPLATVSSNSRPFLLSRSRRTLTASSVNYFERCVAMSVLRALNKQQVLLQSVPALLAAPKQWFAQAHTLHAFAACINLSVAMIRRFSLSTASACSSDPLRPSLCCAGRRQVTKQHTSSSLLQQGDHRSHEAHQTAGMGLTSPTGKQRACLLNWVD